MQPTGIALIAAIVCLGGCSILPVAELVTTAAAKHSYILDGSGSPTVILQSGLGDGKDSWRPVFAEIARQTQVFAYDRAGYKASRSANQQRTGNTIVRELRATLQALDLKPPYIFVGHSLGGTYVELYARTYPDEIAGVVLVDSRHGDFTRQCEIAEAGSCTPPALLSALLPYAAQKELAGGDQTMAEVLNAAPFPDVPLVVLTRGKPMFTGALFYEVWLETQRSLATLTSESTHTICDRCGHYIHKDAPDLVIAAITSVLKRARVSPSE